MRIKRIVSVLLIVVFSIGLLMNGMITPVKAATTNEEQPEPAAAANYSLEEDETQSQQVEALGLSAKQPARIAPSGKEVDKNKNPLGPNRLNLNRVYQLAMTGARGPRALHLYNDLVGKSALNLAGQHIESPLPDSWNNAQKAVVAADVDGNEKQDGRQEVITAGLLPDGNGRVKLQLYVTDYSDVRADRIGYSRPVASNVYTIVFNLPKPADDPTTGSSLKAVAGDFDHDGEDEVALAVGEKLYLCKVDMQTKKLLSSRTFSRKIGDIKAADADKDGFPDLLVTEDGVDSSGISAQLYIFSGTDLASTRQKIALEPLARGIKFTSASVDMGDLFGDGEKVIVIGGSTRPMISYIKYNPGNERFDMRLQQIYDLSALADFRAVQSRLDIKCVSLKTPVPGDPQYVVLGGFIFQYDQDTDAFKRQDVGMTTINSSGVSGNNQEKSDGSITNVSGKTRDSFGLLEQKTFILQTLVGNFDGNTEGKEQIIMLHYNRWHGSEYVYATWVNWVGTDSGGGGFISADLSQIWKKGQDYHYPAICEADIYNNGITLEFQPGKSKFMYSNPNVMAVLGATPFYKELEDQQVNLYNVGTTYGSATENSESSSKGWTAEVGVSFGFSQGAGVLGVEVVREEFETQITNSFASTWTKAKSISKSVSFTNLYMEDSVVVMVTPYDVYYYKVYSNNNGRIVESEMVMTVPYSPVLTMMPLEHYNQVTANIANAPIIDPDKVIKHTIGDPRSYPRSPQGLSNVEGKDVLLGGNDESGNFIGSGIGNSLSTQSIETSSTSEKSFDYSLSVNVSFSISLFGLSQGRSAGAGYTSNVTVSSTASTIREGSVANVPVEHSEYNFMWALVAYNYDLPVRASDSTDSDSTDSDSTQRITVISYLVKPSGQQFPPAVPSNLRVDSRTLKATTLKWDPAKGADGYRIYRAASKSGTFVEITDPLEGKDTTSYTDQDLTLNRNYFYKILAYASRGKESLMTDPLKVKSLSVEELRIMTQPKLTYDEDEPLDLSELSVRLKIDDGSTEDISFADLANYSMTTSLANGIALKATDSGIPITVKYEPENMIVNTNVLTVNAKSPYDLKLNVSFQVGSNNNATQLRPNQTLSATINLRNKRSSQQQALVILALYSSNGDMVDETHQATFIEPKGKDRVTLTLSLPARVNGYLAKVFVWDGADFSSTTLVPKSESVQIPTL